MSRERIILAMDLSTSHGGLAVVRGAEVLFEAEFVSQRSHNSMLFRPLGEALQAAAPGPDLVVVGTGPGSYTGVRIAIAAAHGVALSRGMPVVGLSSLVAPEAAEDARDFAMVGNARRGSYYVARIRDGKLEAPPELLEEEGLRDWVAKAEAGEDRVYTLDEVAPLDLPGIQATVPSAVLLARRAAELSDEDLASQGERPLEPCYLREAFITTPKRSWLEVRNG